MPLESPWSSSFRLPSGVEELQRSRYQRPESESEQVQKTSDVAIGHVNLVSGLHFTYFHFHFHLPPSDGTAMHFNFLNAVSDPPSLWRLARVRFWWLVGQRPFRSGSCGALFWLPVKATKLGSTCHRTAHFPTIPTFLRFNGFSFHGKRKKERESKS